MVTDWRSTAWSRARVRFGVVDVELHSRRAISERGSDPPSDFGSAPCEGDRGVRRFEHVGSEAPPHFAVPTDDEDGRVLSGA